MPQHRGISPFGNVRRSGCPPAEPYPADDARLSLEISSTPVASSAIPQKSSFAPSPLSSFEPSLSSFVPAPTGKSPFPVSAPQLSPAFFRQAHFYKALIGDIISVRLPSDDIQQRHWHPQGNGLCGKFQLWHRHPHSPGQIQMVTAGAIFLQDLIFFNRAHSVSFLFFSSTLPKSYATNFSAL